jgi:hypothetical protein
MGTLSITCVYLLLAVGSSPLEANPRDQVDVIEINHFHDEQGRLVFEQLIFYEWSEKSARFQVRAWRLIKSDSQRPRFDFNTREYVTTWYDGDLIREVRAPNLVETWTQHDPEVVERNYLAKEKRKELTTAKQKISRTKTAAK